jgi:hypothetical protein
VVRTAGVFMAAALVHLLADAQQNEGLQRWSTADGGRYSFPWASAFCLAGFLFLVWVGELARYLAARQITSAGRIADRLPPHASSTGPNWREFSSYVARAVCNVMWI